MDKTMAPDIGTGLSNMIVYGNGNENNQRSGFRTSIDIYQNIKLSRRLLVKASEHLRKKNLGIG
jgi:hypothetical protein